MSGQARALTPGELAAILNPYAIQKGFKVAALSDNDPDGPCDVLHAVYEGHEQVSENEWEPSVELVELRDTDDYDDFLLGVIATQAAELARAQAGAQAVEPTFEQAVKRLLSSGTSEDYSIVLVARAQSLGQCRRVVYGMTHDLQGGHLSGHDENEYEGYFFEARLPDESRALAQASAEGAGAGEVAG